MNYSIRTATPSDAQAIAKVALRTWEVTYAQSVVTQNREQFLESAYALPELRETIRQARGWFFVAAHAETVVGFSHFLRRFDAQGELVRIYIHPEHQRHGIGRAFLSTGLAAMAETGINLCYVSVEVNNTAARAFYERFGFLLRREYGRFFGDQIIRLVEYSAPIASLLGALTLKERPERN